MLNVDVLTQRQKLDHIGSAFVSGQAVLSEEQKGKILERLHLKEDRDLFTIIFNHYADPLGCLKEIRKDSPGLEVVLQEMIRNSQPVNGEFPAIVECFISEESGHSAHPMKIDTSVFKPLSSEDIKRIVGLTVKQDDENKLIAFLGLLSAYTNDSQMNISFNAPSSTGKSYVPTEIAKLFPAEDVIELGYCSPTAFFHSHGEYSKEQNGFNVDLERKIVIFLDQPHDLLLQHLRPMLSHDSKVIKIMIADKTQKAGTKTKNIFLKGFPAVVFCTAGLKIDEQECTRFLLLSPETSQEKVRAGVLEKIKRSSDPEAYSMGLEANPERKLLKQRILGIKQERIGEIKCDAKKIEEAFFANKRILKPRAQRDIGRLIGIVKTFALLNCWFRERDGSEIISNEDDVNEAFTLWDKISEAQELNLPPYVFSLYREVILAAYREKNSTIGEVASEIQGKLGVTRKDIILMHYDVYGRPLADWQLRQQIIPMLEASGLIIQEADPDDKRKILIRPVMEK